MNTEILNEVSKRYGYTSFQTALEELSLDKIPTTIINTIVEKAIKEYASQFKEPIKGNEGNVWVLCPKCNGQGTVSKPPYIAGDVHKWSSTSAQFVCDVCNGSKVLSNQYTPIKSNDELPKNIFFIDEVNKLINELLKEEMSIGKFVEILNEKATGISALERFKNSKI